MSTHAGFSQRLQALAADPGASAWSLHARAREQQRAGRDVILLSVGDPDFDTPPGIVDAAVDALRGGRTHYPPIAGEPALREAIAAYHQAQAHRPVRSAQVQVTAGAQNALFNVAQALLDPGDQVVLIEPCYATYPSVVLAAGGVPVRVASRAVDGFVPRLEDILRAVGPRTRMLLLNSPSNPSGSVLPRETLAALADDARRRGYWLVSDEVYADLRFDGAHESLLAHAEEGDRIVVLGSASKRLAMSGWRLGWCVGPTALIEAMTTLAAAQLFGTPTFIQDAMAVALCSAQPQIAQMRAEYQRRAECVSAALASIEGLRCTRPQGGMFLLLDLSALGANGTEFAEGLLAAEAVSLIAGVAFGQSTRDQVRLSLVQPEARLLEACRRIARYVAARG